MARPTKELLQGVDSPASCSAEFLPRGVYQRPNGWGVQLYRVNGSALGEMETPLGCGKSVDDAVADAKARGNWPNSQPTGR